jgi:hypothetical protein
VNRVNGNWIQTRKFVSWRIRTQAVEALPLRGSVVGRSEEGRPTRASDGPRVAAGGWQWLRGLSDRWIRLDGGTGGVDAERGTLLVVWFSSTDCSMERERELWAQAMSKRQGWFGDVHANRELQPGWDAKPSERGRLEQDLQHVRNQITELQGRNSGYRPRAGPVGGGSARLGPVLEIPRAFLHRVLCSNLTGIPVALKHLYHVELRDDLVAFDVQVLNEDGGDNADSSSDLAKHGAGVVPDRAAQNRCIEVCLAEPVVSVHWTEISIGATLPPPPARVRENRARPPSRAALRGWDTKKVRGCITYATMLDAEPAFLFFSQDKGHPRVLSVCGSDVQAVRCEEAKHSTIPAGT